MVYMTFVIIVVSLLYFAVIVTFTVGWMKLEEPVKRSGLTTKVSLVLAARNEEATILSCLHDIEKQDYPSHLLEVIIVDDCSFDNTRRVVTDFIQSIPGNHFRLFKNPETDPSQANKKQAIDYAVSQSTGDLIITSDADTLFESGRVSAIVDFYESSGAKMILGPVVFHHGNSFFERVQTLEFLGLMGVTGGSCRSGWPVMCNGANLAYERTAFTSVGGYQGNMEYRSGDDVFLMVKIRKAFGPGAIQFLKSPEAVVVTEAKGTIREFVQQRLRWVSKSKGIKDAGILSVALVTWLFNASLLAGIIAGFFNENLLWLPLIVLAAKMAVEFPLLLMTARWFRRTKFLLYYPVAQLLNIFYVVFIGLLGNFLPYKWKGRKG
jgi:cellulose synthase/poly-beta-1,6-N-acetylglucosamine synthase-like glycosyltransferase